MSGSMPRKDIGLVASYLLLLACLSAAALGVIPDLILLPCLIGTIVAAPSFVGGRDVAHLVHYVLLLSLHLFFILNGFINRGIALFGAAICGVILSLVLLAYFDRDWGLRLGRWAFLLYISLLGLLILMDLVLAVTDGEPFARGHRR